MLSSLDRACVGRGLACACGLVRLVTNTVVMTHLDICEVLRGLAPLVPFDDEPLPTSWLFTWGLAMSHLFFASEPQWLLALAWVWWFLEMHNCPAGLQDVDPEQED